MQFLQTLVLSHNPLSVIEDTWFFKLPSVTHLDLGATRVTRQTLLMLLLRTPRLETLKLSIDTACCLCQHKHSTETPCRTLSFDCMSVCSSTAPRCGNWPTALPMCPSYSEPSEPVSGRKLLVTDVLLVCYSSPGRDTRAPEGNGATQEREQQLCVESAA
ncbi:leucine-rich repeat-containing protein 37B-like [Neopsephotus bourkii]|uniref:leucine-rich repeat-containing protein 37B-like n=1 Tax=Neopsephotus bourkii TaxID=309878 RepID=UPI002AA50D61|nr:leucine-rich repeat-containing protein 37B-like [Neopsephotus bourkii]